MKPHVLRRGAAILTFICVLIFADAADAVASPDPSIPTVTPLAVSQCPLQYTCLWVNAGYNGGPYISAINDSNFTGDSKLAGCTHVGFNDCASSAYNHGQNCTVYLWTAINYSGRYHRLALGDFVSDFASSASPPTGFSDPSFNDAVSSLHWCTPK
jgi:peptidase inhibitor family I36